jgi:hypothetical protein
MILKKQEKNGTITATYASSNICASTYNKETKDLVITYNNGGQYKYPGVTLTDYTRFEMADSQGAVFNTHIKKYLHEKLDKVDVAQLLAEVTNLKEAEYKLQLENATIIMMYKLKALVTFHDRTGSIDANLLTSAFGAITNFQTKFNKK